MIDNWGLRNNNGRLQTKKISMMNKELVLSMLEELGFRYEEVENLGYIFKYEELAVLFMPDDDDNFLRFAIPGIYDVTEDNKTLVLEVVNATNMTVKYSKTCIYNDEVWIFYEYRVFDVEHLEEIVRHSMLLLQATYFLFHRKIEGDDSLPYEDDDTDDSKEEDEV